MTPNLVISITDARRRFDELVDRAERGERIVITRYGKPAAVLISISDGKYLERIAASASVS